jgi:hypothetical protein
MPQVYDNKNERVKLTINPEDGIDVFVGNSKDDELSVRFTIDVPTAEDLLEGLQMAIEHVKAKRKSSDGY